MLEEKLPPKHINLKQKHIVFIFIIWIQVWHEHPVETKDLDIILS